MQLYANPPLSGLPLASSTPTVDEHRETFFSPNSLDTSAETSPGMADSRRESFVTGPPLFSPKTEDWQSVDMQSIPSNNAYDRSQPFTTSSSHIWGLPGQATSLPQFDPAVAAGFELPASIYQNAAHAPMPFPGSLFGAMPSESHQDRASPRKDWHSVTKPVSQKAANVDGDLVSSQIEQRRDGVRKRNARFDIPADHNLNNIDQLIAESTNELEIKELKQQKRLLRNRQAALDSRQRKKQHTEQLEDEKKQFTATIGELDSEINTLRIQIDELQRDNQIYRQCVEALTAQKDEMIRTHTIETRELRKRNSILTENIKLLENNSVATPGPSACLNGTFGEVDSMCMPGSWDNTNFLHQFDTMAEAPKHNPSDTQSKKFEVRPSGEGEKTTAQGGLLFMLFLVGALVMSSPSPPTIPRASEDVRSASAALLDNVLKDAGMPSAEPMQVLGPQPSAASWGAAIASSAPVHEAAAPSILSKLPDFLQPAQEQVNEQVFSISAAQYNGVSDQTFMQVGASARMPGHSQGRKNLAAALADIRATNKESGSADVYTRTLLWDQIPRDVVRDFINMFAEHNAAQIEPQQCNEIMS